MSKRQVQWLKKLFQSTFDNQPSNSPKSSGEAKQVQPPPELTNADLEALFIELLEGVYQARGQHWALKFLQRMENRISQDRWLEWLETFGEKLLSSSAPNYQLAERMVQLGELEVGVVGDFAYEIGTELLTRGFGEPNWPTPTQEPNLDSAVPDYSETEDMGNLAEVVFVEDRGEIANASSLPFPHFPLEDFTDNFGELLVFDNNGEQNWSPIVAEPAASTPQEEEIVNLISDTVEPRQPFITQPSLTLPPLTQEDLRENLPPLVFDFTAPDIQGVPPLPPQPQASSQDFASSYTFAPNHFAAQIPIPSQSQFDLTLPPITGGIDNTQVLESSLDAANTINLAVQEVKAATSAAMSWDGTLANVPPNLANTLDELLVRLQQSVDLVQQMTMELRTRSTSPPQYTQLRDALPPPETIIEPGKAWFYKGLEQVKQGDLGGAVESYNRALAIAPDNHEFWFSQGLTFCYLGAFDEALDCYDNVVRIKPNFERGWYYRGGVLCELGRYQEAISSFNQALEIKPDYYEVWSSRGGALLELGEPEVAISSYDKAIAFQPYDADTWYHRGVALSEIRQYHHAIASFDKAIEIQPDFYLAYYSKALTLSNLGQDAEAISALSDSINLQPNFYAAWYYRGSTLYKLGRIEEAITSYERAAELQSDFHEAWIDRGVALFNLGQFEAAIASYDIALEIRPDLHLAWYNRGVALENLGRRTDAIVAYDKALSIVPDLYFAWYNRGVALFYLGQYEEAIASYDHALEIKPDYWEAWLGRGSAVGCSAQFDADVYFASRIALTNPALKLRGYEGKIANYEQGLKFVNPETQAEGWGRLHLVLGNTYYECGKKYSAPIEYWLPAQNEYNLALSVLSADAEPQLHLEVLQQIIMVLLGLGNTLQAQEVQTNATDLWWKLLIESNFSDEDKKQLALKFTPLGQLAVDVAVARGELLSALEIAEHVKNACIAWQTTGWTPEIYSPNYVEMQKLLNPTTAIVYWHVSPYSLRTFIIKHKSTEPLPIFTPVLNISNDELPLPEAVGRLVEFEDWLKDWNQQYQDYELDVQDKVNKSNHSWRKSMEEKLLQLKEILKISAVVRELEGIDKLILVPHRDLHKLPLHALFYLNEQDAPFKGNISYLPSLKLGLIQKSKSALGTKHNSFFSVEFPNSNGYPTLQFGKLESEVASLFFDYRYRLQGSKATKKELENALSSGYNIFHFTGHAIDNLNHPDDSQLALAGDDRLALREIQQQQLANYKLVTLSFCETKVNAKQNLAQNFSQNISTEYVGLVYSFLDRGVGNVVSTLWNVESAATTLVMIEFYQRIQQNKSPVAALNEVTAWLKELTALELTKWYEDLLNQLPPEGLRVRAHLAADLLRSSKITPTQKVYNHPYYWAAFTVSGLGNGEWGMGNREIGD